MDPMDHGDTATLGLHCACPIVAGMDPEGWHLSCGARRYHDLPDCAHSEHHQNNSHSTCVASYYIHGCRESRIPAEIRHIGSVSNVEKSFECSSRPWVSSENTSIHHCMSTRARVVTSIVFPLTTRDFHYQNKRRSNSFAPL